MIDASANREQSCDGVPKKCVPAGTRKKQP